MWQKREYWEGLKEKWDIRSPGSGCADLKFVEKNDLSKKKNLSKNYLYSWVRLVRPYTEELISRPFVGENRFRLVLQARMGPENAIGCIIFPPGATFFCPNFAHCFRCSVGISNGFVLKQVTWICQTNKSM